MPSLTESLPAQTVTTELHPLTVFFDGKCVFCNRWINRIRDADYAHRLRFATKQGYTFQQVAEAHPELIGVESIVIAKRRADGTDEFLIRTAGIREVIAGLAPFRAFAFILKIVPTPLADLGYRIFSKFRTRLFGKLNTCRVPTAAERDLFLD